MHSSRQVNTIDPRVLKMNLVIHALSMLLGEFNVYSKTNLPLLPGYKNLTIQDKITLLLHYLSE